MEFLIEIYDYFQVNQFELYGLVFGVTCVYLNLKENIWAWPTGIISVSFLCYVYWEARLFGDLGLHVIYIVLGFYGWYSWLYGGKAHTKLSIVYSSRKELIGLLLLGIVATWGLGYFLEQNTSASLPYWDATTTVFSLIAQYQLTQKKIENWLVWVTVDILCIGIYYVKDLHIVMVLYVIYLILATAGWFNWKKLYYQQSLNDDNTKSLQTSA